MSYTYTIEKRYISITDFQYWQIRSDGIQRHVNSDHASVINYKGEINKIDYIPYVDPRTNEEKRNDDYKSIIDPITQKILSYQLECELEVDPVRKATIEKDIIKPLKDEWISKRKSIRSKYPGGLWKPTA